MAVTDAGGSSNNFTNESENHPVGWVDQPPRPMRCK